MMMMRRRRRRRKRRRRRSKPLERVCDFYIQLDHYR